MPASCAKALRPTTALLGGGKTPVRCDSSWLVRKISRALTLVRNETDRGRTRPAITISSSEALPARSPMPFTVHSTWVAPAATAASEFATASPRSSWQWQLRATPRALGTRSRTARNIAPRSEEHTSELQSPCNLVCRLLLEKKKKNNHAARTV